MLFALGTSKERFCPHDLIRFSALICGVPYATLLGLSLLVLFDPHLHVGLYILMNKNVSDPSSRFLLLIPLRQSYCGYTAFTA